MLHPEMLRAVADAHIRDLRRGGPPRSNTTPRSARRRASATLGWTLIEIGVRLAARSQPYQAAATR